MTDRHETRSEATRDAYGRVLAELGSEREDIVVLDADLSGSTRTRDFARRFPHRFFNAGIAEQNLMGMAAGLALCGKIPFASTFAIFATGRAWEQVRTSISYPGLRVRIVGSHSGLTVGADGASHQPLEDVALMRSIPGMTVVVPKDGPETEKVIRAVVDLPGPIYVRLGRPKVPVLSRPGQSFALGRPQLLRAGGDVALLANGIMVDKALRAAEMLAGEGISAAVANVHTVKPLDVESLVDICAGARAVVTAEEHSVIGGLGGAVAEILGEHHPLPMRRVGVRDRFGQSGEPEELLRLYGLTASDIAEAARNLLS